MGLCGNITRYLLYVTIPLAAVLVFFHLECSIEKEWAFENKFNDEYNPAVTECSSALYRDSNFGVKYIYNLTNA